MKDLKESNPVEIAEYVAANKIVEKIVEKPGFKWLIANVLR